MKNPLVPKAQIRVFGIDESPAVYALMFDCIVPDVFGFIGETLNKFKIGTLIEVESRPHRYELRVSTCYDIQEVAAWLESLGE